MEFAPEIVNRIEKDYIEKLPYFGDLSTDIGDRISALTGVNELFMKYLYAYMPLSDAGAYEYETIYSYAAHAAFLLENSPYTEKVPQEYFFNYILSHRINSEDITDCRRLFYDMVKERIGKMTMSEAVLELNNWCYEQATYRSTSERTASPITVYKSGFGRCGEESTFLVTVLRSAGIPARQIYVPRWSHSDSNHAWVEVWCDGKWYFTGACEPKPVLNNGWFTYPASKAMLTHSRLFTGFGYEMEEIVERDGVVTLINNSDRYSLGKYLTVKVLDTEGRPVKDAMVRFEIINSSEFIAVAVLKTDMDGIVRIKLGLGDVHLHVIKDGLSHMRTVNNKVEDVITIILHPEEAPVYDIWQDFRILAAESAYVNGMDMTPEQEKEQERKNIRGDRIRQERIDGYYDSEYVKQFQEYPDIEHVLMNAKGNFEEIRKFLDNDYAGVELEDKAALLKYITLKDCRDIMAVTLEDQLEALQYKKVYPKMTYEKYVLSPCIYMEKPSPFRAFIKKQLGDKGYELVGNPRQLWEWINQEIKYYPDKEYTTIVASPQSVLMQKAGTPMSKKVLFVAISRTYGLAARLDEIFSEPQYWVNGTFVFVNKEFTKKASLTLVSEETQTPGYYQQFTVGRKQQDGTYETLELWSKKFTNGKLALTLVPGDYRVLTCDRMKSGSIVGKQLYITLAEGERKTYKMESSSMKTEDLQQISSLPEFTLRNKEEQTVSSIDFLGDGKSILIFADAGKEPTEHVFNELLEISRMSGEPDCSLHFVIKDDKALTDETFRKIRNAFLNSDYWYDEFQDTVRLLGNAVGVDVNKLPLVLVTEGSSRSLYACSGYNVGCVDILMRLVK